MFPHQICQPPKVGVWEKKVIFACTETNSPYGGHLEGALQSAEQAVFEITNLNDWPLLSFLYVSRKDCGVCHAVLPKLRELLDKFPLIHLGHVNAYDVEEVAANNSYSTRITFVCRWKRIFKSSAFSSL